VAPQEEELSSDAIIEEMVSKVDTSISESIKDQLRLLLKKYSSVISKHELDLGWTDLVSDDSHHRQRRC